MAAHRRAISELANFHGGDYDLFIADKSKGSSAAKLFAKECAETGSNIWTYSSLIGARNRDHYLAALDLLLKNRHECYRIKKTQKFWKNYALEMNRLVDKELPMTPSPSDISETGAQRNVPVSHLCIERERRAVFLPDSAAGNGHSGGNITVNNCASNYHESQQCVKTDDSDVVELPSSDKVMSDSFLDAADSTLVESKESISSISSLLHKKSISQVTIKQHTVIASDRETSRATRGKQITSAHPRRSEVSATTVLNGPGKNSKSSNLNTSVRGTCKMFESLTKVTGPPLRSTPPRKKSSLLPVSSVRSPISSRSPARTNPLAKDCSKQGIEETDKKKKSHPLTSTRTTTSKTTQLASRRKEQAIIPRPCVASKLRR